MSDIMTDHIMNRHPAPWRERDFYRFWTTENVRFADLDALGHVNNNSYGIYFDVARTSLWSQIFKGNFWEQTHFSLLRAAHIEYHKELHFPNRIDLGVRILSFGNSSSHIATGIFVNDVCHATSHTIGVLIDGKTRAITPIPDERRELLQPYM